MANHKKLNAAELLVRQIKSTKPRQGAIVQDEFAQAIARRMQQRGIANTPGLAGDEPELKWYDVSIEMHRRHREFEAKRKAEDQAERLASQSTTDLIRSTLAGAASRPASNTIPLNGTRVLRAALAGGEGTINSTFM